MANLAARRRQKFANNDLPSDVTTSAENIKDLGDSVGHMADRQYERAQDVATDAIQETGDAIQRNSLIATESALALVSYSAWPGRSPLSCFVSDQRWCRHPCRPGHNCHGSLPLLGLQ